MPRWIQRVFLVLLLIVFAAIQARYTVMTVRLLVEPHDIPRLEGDFDPVKMSFTSVSKSLQQAGIKEGDVLVAVNGKPVTSMVAAMRDYYSHKPGDRIPITFRRRNGAPVTVDYQIVPEKEATGIGFAMPIMLNILTPWSCIILGFLVAFRRTGDPVAYALLALLLCQSQMVHADAGPSLAWEPLFTWPDIFLSAFAFRAAMAAWLWFSILFPDADSKYKIWPWARWVLGVPYLVATFAVSIYYAAVFHNAAALPRLKPLTDIPDWLAFSWAVAMLALAITNLVYKWLREERPGMRRRLRWMLLGLALGLLPIALLFVAAAILQRDINKFPLGLLLPAVMMPFFIPLTLAYAVFVNRLFDIGVVIRQGLLASKTVTVVRLVLVGVLIWYSVQFERQKDLSDFQRWLGIVVIAVAAILLKRASVWAGAYVDRHFFRETVNSEHLLAELSGQVRSISNPQILLRTVTERIAKAMHVVRVAALLPRDGRLVPAFAMGTDSGSSPLEWSLDDPIVARLREDRQPVLVAGELLLPLTATGADELQGILSLGPKRSEEPYSKRDLQLLESVANQTALALENTRLTAAVAQEAAQRERITSELEIARQVQQRLFPKSAPHAATLDLAGQCRPAQTIGGDYYDFSLRHPVKSRWRSATWPAKAFPPRSSWPACKRRYEA